MATTGTATSPIWRPLALPVFRALWIASVASNVGTVMHDTAAGWLMTSLSRSAILVALMQTASSLPMFLLSLPSGALADVVDRRRLLMVTQAWMLAAAGTLGVLTVLHVTSPWVLLGLTFTMGLGNALNGPAWQAVTPELVAAEDLTAAVALGGAGYNLGRAVGPAIAGFIIAAAGSGAVFLLNAASFVGVLIVLSRWQRRPRQSLSPTERVMGAMRAGTRYVRHSLAMRAVLVRAGVFILCGSALWALLPLLARHVLGLGSVGYGVLLGCLGAGAVAGAVLLPSLQARFSIDQVVGGGTVLFAAAIAALGAVRSPLLAGVTMAAAGVAWLVVMSSLNVAAQTVLPAWVRARGLAVYLLVFQGGLAAGSALWGAVASHEGIPYAFVYAALGLLVGLAAALRYPLAAHAGLDLTPAMHWPVPAVAAEPHPEDGPVLVTVVYRIEPRRADEFAEAMRAVARLRRRDGAIRWGLFRDTAEPERYVETFIVESWAEHLRQHERITVADLAIEQRAFACQVEGARPVVRHYLYAYTIER